MFAKLPRLFTKSLSAGALKVGIPSKLGGGPPILCENISCISCCVASLNITPPLASRWPVLTCSVPPAAKSDISCASPLLIDTPASAIALLCLICTGSNNFLPVSFSTSSFSVFKPSIVFSVLTSFCSSRLLPTSRTVNALNSCCRLCMSLM